MGRKERLRMEGGWHPLNQKGEKNVRDRTEKGYRSMDENVKAELREERIRRSQEEFEEMLALRGQQGGLDTNSADGDFGQDRMMKGEKLLRKREKFQLGRALGHILKNRATPQEIDYFFKHTDELGPTAIVGETIVDFTDPAKKELPDAA